MLNGNGGPEEAGPPTASWYSGQSGNEPVPFAAVSNSELPHPGAHAPVKVTVWRPPQPGGALGELSAVSPPHASMAMNAQPNRVDKQGVAPGPSVTGPKANALGGMDDLRSPSVCGSDVSFVTGYGPTASRACANPDTPITHAVEATAAQKNQENFTMSTLRPPDHRATRQDQNTGQAWEQKKKSNQTNDDSTHEHQSDQSVPTTGAPKQEIQDVIQSENQVAAPATGQKNVSQTDGLSDEDVTQLRELHGYNEVITKEQSALQMIMQRYLSLMPMILMIAAILSVSVQEKPKPDGTRGPRDWLSFGLLLFLLNLTVWADFIADRNANSAIKAVERLSAVDCRCKRNGKFCSVEVRKSQYARETKQLLGWRTHYSHEHWSIVTMSFGVHTPTLASGPNIDAEEVGIRA
eukprot:GHVT01100633.1.p1 GENE.GHVT01100633.1~~GHVT01100633.1.p1  ORF type:complete len:408 (+),score=54.97 GHVT01100633.1:1142-2365(+)